MGNDEFKLYDWSDRKNDLEDELREFDSNAKVLDGILLGGVICIVALICAMVIFR